MPPSKPKPSEIAAEAKRTYIPWIRQNHENQTSFLCHSESMVAQPSGNPDRQVHFAFYDEDPVDLAIKWRPTEKEAIPVIMPANDKRPGGDWEAGVMSPEECLCRRSSLFATITTPGQGNPAPSNYPIPPKAGIYSENVVVFRNGPERYEPWHAQEYKTIPVISVCPVKRPKLDTSGKKYSFKQEKELMRDKIRTVLRIAIWYGYPNLCIGTFGLGPGFRNPPEEVASMWRDAFLKDPEFQNHFTTVVFAFQNPEGPNATTSSSSKSSSKSSSSKSSSSKSTASSDLDIFRQVFKPANIHGAFKA